MQMEKHRIALVLLILTCFLSGLMLAQGEKKVADSAAEVCPILIGSTVPDVSFKTLEGEDFSLKQAVNEKPALLIFYRGGW